MTNQETTKVEEKNRQSTDEDIRELIRRESRGYDVNSPTNESKRRDYLTWDDYFLAVACLNSMRSKDPAPNLVGGGGVRCGRVGTNCGHRIRWIPTQMPG
jgi:deoxycytidylate deaminase